MQIMFRVKSKAYLSEQVRLAMSESDHEQNQQAIKDLEQRLSSLQVSRKKNLKMIELEDNYSEDLKERRRELNTQISEAEGQLERAKATNKILSKLDPKDIAANIHKRFWVRKELNPLEKKICLQEMVKKIRLVGDSGEVSALITFKLP